MGIPLYQRVARVLKMKRLAAGSARGQTPNQMMMSSTNKTEGEDQNI